MNGYVFAMQCSGGEGMSSVENGGEKVEDVVSKECVVVQWVLDRFARPSRR